MTIPAMHTEEFSNRLKNRFAKQIKAAEELNMVAMSAAHGSYSDIKVCHRCVQIGRQALMAHNMEIAIAGIALT